MRPRVATVTVDSTTVLLAVVSGVAIGSVYALVAIGFNLVFAATRYIHFALSSIVMLGAVFSYLLQVEAGLSTLVTVAVIVLGGALAGVLSEVVAVAPLQRRSGGSVATAVLLSTLALGLIVNGIAAVWFGPNAQIVPSYVDGPPVDLGGIPVRRTYLVMVAALLLLTLVLEIVVRRTGIGRTLRAVQEDPEGAMLAGIHIRRVGLTVFAIAGGLAGLAGFLIAPVSYASVQVGNELFLYGFAAMALGGFGSFLGGVLGGLVVGLVSYLSPLFLPQDATQPLILLVLLLVLFAKPSGLMARANLREV